MNETATETPAQTRASAAEVRTWARGNGYAVGNRGRIAKEIREAFAKATGPQHA